LIDVAVLPSTLLGEPYQKFKISNRRKMPAVLRIAQCNQQVLGHSHRKHVVVQVRESAAKRSAVLLTQRKVRRIQIVRRRVKIRAPNANRRIGRQGLVEPDSQHQEGSNQEKFI
jgi:hypothetical protein